MEEKRWEGKRVIKNILTWDKQDLFYVILTILIIIASYSYYSEIKISRQAIENPEKFCIDHSLYTLNLQETINNLTKNYCPCSNLSLRGLTLSDG